MSIFHKSEENGKRWRNDNANRRGKDKKETKKKKKKKKKKPNRVGSK